MRSVGVLAVLLVGSVAVAQPMLDPSNDPRRRETTSSGPSATIPVTGPTGEVIQSDAPLGIVQTPPASLEQPIDPNTYVCGPGDVFQLEFWGQQNFRFRIVVDPEGRAFIPRVGFVTAAGKTLSAVRTAIRAKVRGNYPGLQSDLTLVTARTFTVHIVDNVARPGSYTSTPVQRLSAVIAQAGVLPSSSRRRISVKHRDGTTTSADLVLYEITGDTNLNPYLVDGDVVNVPFAEPVVRITGAVRRPGMYELVKTKDLAELVALAGGFTSSVVRSMPIKIVRRNERQQETVIDVAFVGSPPVPPTVALQDDDAVRIPASEEVQRTVLLIGATPNAESVDAGTTGKRLPFVEGDTVLSLLDRAGGVNAPGDLKRAFISRPKQKGAPEVIPVDLDALLVRRDLSADRKISIGDTIVVPPMQFAVLVEGAVARAGLYNYNPSYGIAEYIARAGGRTRTARDLDDAVLIDANGATHPFRASTKPTPGDAILVPERNYSRSEVAQLVLAGASVVLGGIAVALAATR